MENIDVCENCHYPIVPLDGKTTVRGKTRGLVRELGGMQASGERNRSSLQVLEVTAGPPATQKGKEPQTGKGTLLRSHSKWWTNSVRRSSQAEVKESRRVGRQARVSPSLQISDFSHPTPTAAHAEWL